MTWIEQLEQVSQTIAKLQAETDRTTPAGCVTWAKLHEAKHVIITRIITEQAAARPTDRPSGTDRPACADS